VGARAHRILIVDDDMGMAETCARLFQRQGWAPLVAGSGQEALGRLEADPEIELVLTDLVMPDLSGVELLQAAKRRDPTLAVIIMTGYGTIQNAVQAMKLGASDYLTKPFDKEQILAAVEKAAIIRALQATDGNKSKAAERLGIARDRLYRKIERYGIEA